MQKLLMRCLVLAALIAAGAGVPAVQAQSAAKPKMLSEFDLPGLQNKVSLDLKEPMDIVDFIKFLAIKGGLNVVIGNNVAGTTKLMIEDVTVGQALEIVLSANNLAYELKGNIIKVMTADEYNNLYGQSFYDRKTTKVLYLKYAVPSRVAQLLEKIKSQQGQIIFDDNTGALIMIDTPEKIQAMEPVAASEEQPTAERTVTKTFTLQHAVVDDIEKEVTPMLTKDLGKLRKDTRTKNLIITDLPHVMQRIENVISTFDRQARQVAIEAKIVEVTLTDETQLGVNWDHLFQSIDPRFSLQSASAVVPSTMSEGGALSYKTIVGGGDLNVVLKALQNIGDTKILSTPHIAAVDGQEATLKVVENQPYAELQFESGTTNVVGYTYQFIEVGVSLSVTPRINDEQFISMSIKPEVSTIIDWYSPDARSDATKNAVPVVRKSYAETSIQVRDGSTIIIAGMIKEEKDKSTTQIPILGKIPLIGFLFRYTDVKKESKEMVVFLTPRIVTGDEGASGPTVGPKPFKGVRESAAEVKPADGATSSVEPQQ